MNLPGSAKNEISSAFEAKRSAHRNAGLTARTVEAWSIFTDTYTDLNDSLTGTPKFQTDDERALVFEEVLNDYSEDVYTKYVVYKNSLEAQAAARHTVLDSLPTVMQAATTILGRIEGKEERDRIRDGSAFLGARDPQRPNPGGRNKREKKASPFKKKGVWTKDKDRLCSICKGEHWDPDCPMLKPSGGGSGKTAAAGSANVFSVAGLPNLSNPRGDITHASQALFSGKHSISPTDPQ